MSAGPTLLSTTSPETPKGPLTGHVPEPDPNIGSDPNIGAYSNAGAARPGRRPLTTKLHVGNLGRWMTDDELHALFTPAGTVVRAHVLTHGQTGTSRGFGHVEMGAEAEAREAVARLHRAAIAGLRLIVRPVEEFPTE